MITPKEYLITKSLLEARIELIRMKIENALKEVDSKPPQNLRPVHVNDITVGALLWICGDDGLVWRTVCEIDGKISEWKGWTASECGCRYGFDGVFVEVKGE